MALNIHYIDSVVPQLNEILKPLVQKHINFKLNDSFRIITPDLVSREDIENLLVTEPALQRVLIGKSILSLPDFFQRLLIGYPAPSPLAKNRMELKALRLALQKEGKASAVDTETLRQYLFELKRFRKLSRLRLGDRKNSQNHPLDFAYQKIILEKFGLWTQEKAEIEALNFLRNGKPPETQNLQEIYLIGFTIPDPGLLYCLEILKEKYPELEVNLFIPPPSRLIDPAGVLAPMLEFLAGLADQILEYSRLSPPSPEKIAFSTPLHEGLSLYQKITQDSQNACIISPSNALCRPYLENEFIKQQNLSYLEASPPKVPHFRPIEIIHEVKSAQDSDQEIYFSEFYKALEPLFQDSRVALAHDENLPGLRYLEACHERLTEWLMAETFHEELKTSREWGEELEEDFLELQAPAPIYPSKRMPIRTLANHGLKLFDRIYIPGLNEGTYPPQSRHYLVLDPAQDTLWSHEGNLAFEQSLYQAKDGIQMSYPLHSMSGRSLGPSMLIEDLDPDKIQQDHSPPPLSKSTSHPFVDDNIQREIQRLSSNPSNRDQGNLSDCGLTHLLKNSLKNRPMSASYINDYPKCPWLFFARWHLKLQKIPEESLEMEPILRGSFLHELLEIVFRSLIQQYLSKNEVPTLENLIEVLEQSTSTLFKKIPEYPEAELFPKKVLEDEIRRIHIQVLGLLENELENWTNSKERLLPRFLEWRFGYSGLSPVEIPLETGFKIPFRGAIDRIDVSENDGEFLVIDYKSAGSESFAKEIREKINFQLYLYQYAVRSALLQNKTALGGLYWDLKKLKKNQGMVIKDSFKQFNSKRLQGYSFLSEEKFLILQNELDQALKSALTKIMEGNYSLEPDHCLGSRCSFHEICRYEDRAQ